MLFLGEGGRVPELGEGAGGRQEFEKGQEVGSGVVCRRSQEILLGRWFGCDWPLSRGEQTYQEGEVHPPFVCQTDLPVSVSP